MPPGAHGYLMCSLERSQAAPPTFCGLKLLKG